MITGTASRHSEPRPWRRALELSIAAGRIPGATATTTAVYEHLARRMDYSTGEVRYCREEMMRDLGLSKSALSKHVALLRAAGWLAWAVHGTKRNIRRVLGYKGYAATATVYAATIPPEFDAWRGNVLDGTGYKARVIGMTAAGRRRAVNARKPVDNHPVDNSAGRSPWTPSPGVVSLSGHLNAESGYGTSTARARTARKDTPKRTRTVTGYKITGERIETARRLAVTVRPLVNWLQGARYDQLSWVFLDLVARGWSEARIVLWLRQLGAELGMHRWRPRFPHRLIAAALHRQDRREKHVLEDRGADYEADLRRAAPPNAAAVQAFAETKAAAGEVLPLADYPTVDRVPDGPADWFALREAAATDPALVVAYAHVAGRDEALRVYGAAAAAVLEQHAAGFGVTL